MFTVRDVRANNILHEQKTSEPNRSNRELISARPYQPGWLVIPVVQSRPVQFLLRAKFLIIYERDAAHDGQIGAARLIAIVPGSINAPLKCIG